MVFLLANAGDSHGPLFDDYNDTLRGYGVYELSGGYNGCLCDAPVEGLCGAGFDIAREEFGGELCDYYGPIFGMFYVLR